MLSISTSIAGIPCKVDLYYYDEDKQGFFNLDYGICDRRGYRAAWLERKLTPQIRLDIESELKTALDLALDNS